ncbi:MAG: sulfite-sensing transcriptional repressor BigR [Amphiplicatus sp.]
MTAALPLHKLRARADEVAALLKTLSHRNRLLIACQLMEGELSVKAIEERTAVRQPVLSRELARLRRDGLLATRRESRMIHYSLADDRLVALVTALCKAFAVAPKPPKRQKAAKRKTGERRSSRRRA